MKYKLNNNVKDVLSSSALVLVIVITVCLLSFNNLSSATLDNHSHEEIVSISSK